MMLFNSKIFVRFIVNNRIISKNWRYCATVTETGNSVKCSANNNEASKKKSDKVLTLDTINDKIVKMNYPIRGDILKRAEKLVSQLKKGSTKSFKRVILANIGNLHAEGQASITFLRQLAMLALYPQLMYKDRFPSDAKKRVAAILNDCLGQSLGSYTHSQGIKVVRKHIAEYIILRDGSDAPVDPDDIFMSDGSAFIKKAVLSLFSKEIDEKPTGCMLPVPQYPLYSATLPLMQLYKVDYYLDEDNNWTINPKELKRAFEEGQECCVPRILVIINPGNPTGHLLSRKCIEDTIKFAFNEKLVIFADEECQDNVYGEEAEFQSFRKVMTEMGMPYSKMELISFHSASKGFAGEAGFRAGYAEFFNINQDVKNEMAKLVSVALCPNAAGQVVFDGIINPPKEVDPSWELYKKEQCQVLTNLSNKAKKLVELLKTIDQIECNPVQGAIYAFPKIQLPINFVKLAEEKNQEPDVLFAQKLLDEKGICVVPGSAFGQKQRTYHFRTTILPRMETLDCMVSKLKDFIQHIYLK